MAVEYTWYASNRTLQVDYTGEINLDDLQLTSKLIQEYDQKTGAFNINVLIDASGATLSPVIESVTQFRTIFTALHADSVTWLVTAGGSEQLNFLFSTAHRLSGTRMESFDYAGEAIRFLVNENSILRHRVQRT